MEAELAQLNGLKSFGRLLVGREVTNAGINAIHQTLPMIKVIRCKGTQTRIAMRQELPGKGAVIGERGYC